MDSNDLLIFNFEQLEQRQTESGYAFYQRIQKEYQRCKDEISEALEAWYTRFGYHVTLNDARRLLTPDELRQFKQDIKKYLEDKENLDEAWEKHLEEMQERTRVSRYDAIKTKIQHEVEKTSGNFDAWFLLFAVAAVLEYFAQAADILGFTVNQLTEDAVRKLITKPWATDERTFSERITDNRIKLVNDLDVVLTTALIKRNEPEKTIKDISHKLDVSEYNAGRLIMTEMAFFNSTGAYQLFKQAGIDKYELIATIDSRTSDICRFMNHKVFNLSEFRVGSTAPPFHPWCRTVVVPYIEQ